MSEGGGINDDTTNPGVVVAETDDESAVTERVPRIDVLTFRGGYTEGGSKIRSRQGRGLAEDSY